MSKQKVKHTAAQTAMFMAILTLVSKMFGFVREMVMANYFGTEYIVDAYVIAFKILTVIFGGLIFAISTAFIPVYSNVSENKGLEEGDQFTSQVICLMLVITVSVSVVGVLLSDQIVALVTGFSGETSNLTSFFVKIFFSYVIFSSVSGLFDSYSQYRGTFLPQIVGGYSISFCAIIVIVISAHTSPYLLVFGVVIGHFFKLTVSFLVAKNRGYRHSWFLKSSNEIKQLFRLAIPVFLGSSIQSINLFIDAAIASRLHEGSVSALNYASLLNVMIIGVTTTVLSTLIYPKITQANSLGQYERFNWVSSQGLNIVAIIAIPCSIGAMVYSTQIIQIVYERGEFTIISTSMTSSAFFFYAMGMVFLGISDLLNKIYYALNDMKTPMYYGAVGIVVNVALNLILVQFMLHNGLALATSISAFINMLLLYIGARKKHPFLKLFDSKAKLLKITFSAIIAVALSFVVYKFALPSDSGDLLMRIIKLGIPVIIAGLLYIVLLKIFKLKEVELLRQIFSRNK